MKDQFIRDVTKVGSLPKSEVRRRLNELLEEAYDKGRLDVYKEWKAWEKNMYKVNKKEMKEFLQSFAK